MRNKSQHGFTILEIIIAVIIIGVMAGWAMPRLFATVEYSKITEALNTIVLIRGSLERCYLYHSGDYTNCKLTSGAADNTLDIQDPGESPNAHFTYAVSDQDANTYVIVATRNTHEGGDGFSTVAYELDGSDIDKCGCGKFVAIGSCALLTNYSCP